MWLTPKTFKKVSGCTWTPLYANVPECCCHRRLSSQTTAHIYRKFNPEYRNILTFQTLIFHGCVFALKFQHKSNKGKSCTPSSPPFECSTLIYIAAICVKWPSSEITMTTSTFKRVFYYMLSPSHFRYSAGLYCVIRGPLEQNQHI